MKKKLLHVKIILTTWLCRLFFRLGQYFFDINQALLAAARPNPYARLMHLRWYERLQTICKEQGHDAAKFAGITGIPKARMEDYFRGLRRPSKDHRWTIELALATYDVIWGDGSEKGA